jgi:hypothetical protein
LAAKNTFFQSVVIMILFFAGQLLAQTSTR